MIGLKSPAAVAGDVTVPAGVALELSRARGVAGDRQWCHPDDPVGPIKAPPADLCLRWHRRSPSSGSTDYQTWVYPEWTELPAIGVAAAANLDNISNAILLFPGRWKRPPTDFAGPLGICDIR